MALLWFLLMIGPLVLFHELGHYWVARRFDVKCEQFAVGVGPPVATFRRGDTEFSVRALPLGGYVSMLGAQPDEEIAPEDRGRALTDKPIWQRMLIYLAGPAMNVIIAVPIFWIYFLGDTHHEGPEIGTVLDGTPAAEAGLQAGDRVASIDGRRIRYFEQIRRIASRSPERPLEFVVERDGEQQTLTVVPERVQIQDPVVGLRTVNVGQIGVAWARFGSYVDVVAGSPADLAGLRPFDRIVAVNDREVSAWLDLDDTFRETRGDATIRVLRLTPMRDPLAFLAAIEPISLVLPVDQRGVEALGIVSAQATVYEVQRGSPAESAGLRRGDRVESVDGRPVTSLSVLNQMLATRAGESHTLLVRRGSEVLDLHVTPVELGVIGDMRSEVKSTFVGVVGVPGAMVPHELVRMGGGERVWHATLRSVERTAQYVAGIFIGVLFLIIGAVDSSNLGGPLMIAEVAGRAGSEGILTFVRFMAVISINLAIVNLLPVPGLDGGQLMLLTAEGIRREPLSFRARQIANYVGMVCIVLLMLFVFKNDIERYWVDIASWLNS